MKVWFECHGVHHAQYWQGAGGYDGLFATGVGSTEKESADDALESLCQLADLPTVVLLEAESFIARLDDYVTVCDWCESDDPDATRDCCECELGYYTVALLKGA